MPPRRPLPDLCLISVFKMLTPNEQLVASEMSPRCAVLVRAANRTGKTLVIICDNGDLRYLKDTINLFSLASKPIMQQLMDISGEPFPDYPMTTLLSKWNILRLNQLRRIDTDTIGQIVTIFSAVTSLKFMTFESAYIDILVSLLQHPNWQCQLTNLMVDRTNDIDSLAGDLITAINGLTALQLLALHWDDNTNVPDLPILAQLKTVVFFSDNLCTFLRSLERNAVANADLEVHLFSGDTKNLLTLSQPLHSRIVRYDYLSSHHHVPLLCSQLRSLTSLDIIAVKPTEVGSLFTALAQLHQLIHLKFEIVFNEGEKELLPLARPLAQLNSLRALELDLWITSHSQIEWLNLQWTMPSLKTIYIEDFECDSCGSRFAGANCNNGKWTINSSNFLKCFRPSLLNLHLGVPMKRFILQSGEERLSAEKLLLQNQ